MVRSDSGSTGAAQARCDGYVLYRQVGHLLRRAHQRTSAIFGERMSGLELTPLQFAALATVHDHGPVGQNEVGRLTAMDPATVLGVVRRLVGKGLVERRTDRSDRRRRMLQTTARGRRLLEAAIPRALGVSEATLAPLSPAERESFLRLLQRLI